MQIKDVKRLLDTVGIPVSYDHFIKAQTPPFMCYLTPRADNFAADGTVYHSAPEIEVQLYTLKKDVELEQTVEQALAAFYWEKDEGYLKDENRYMVTYQFTI